MQTYRSYLETIFVFLLAASVRLTSLSAFLIVDEEDRWAWAVDFYRALLAGNLPGTLVGDGYPGIFPVWLETVWLLAASIYRSVLQGRWFGEEGMYLLIHEWGRLSNLALQRFPIVLTNTLLVVAIFLYTRQLFGRRVALLAAILISLDPFYLSDSRVNRAEALLTGLMTVSLLALLSGLRWSRRRHLLVSACFGGLAWLTKSQALVLLPMFGLIILVWRLRAERIWQTALHRWLLTMLSWSALAALTFILIWPATWTAPGPTFSLMFNYATRKVGPEGVNLFFLGRTLLDEDPGLLFYPLIFLLRITPVTLIGLGLGGWLIYQKRRQQPAFWRAWLDNDGVWVLIAYALLYVGGMSLGSHKQDRFLMTIFPILNILAAVALVRLVERRRWSVGRVWATGGLVLGLQLITALPFHPYYFTYFNPLLGGGPVASRLTRIGWGEGMDQVAAYLNRQENPAQLTVAARFYKYLLGFEGRTMNLSASGEWLQADKIIFYIQQVQRMQDPSPGVIRYFQQHISPEKVITLDGIDYAWIYANPITVSANPRVSHLPGNLDLFGYIWEETGTGLRIVWFNQQSMPNRELKVGLHNDQVATPWLSCKPAPGFAAAAQTPEEVVESRCDLTELPSLPSGLYDVVIGLDSGPGDVAPLPFPEGRASLSVRPDGSLVQLPLIEALDALAAMALPSEVTSTKITYGNHIRLVGYQQPLKSLHPGATMTVDLYWQTFRPMGKNYTIFAHLFAVNETRLGATDRKQPTSTWLTGAIQQQRYEISLLSDIDAPTIARLDVGLYDDDLHMLYPTDAQGEPLTWEITRLKIIPYKWPDLHDINPAQASFDAGTGQIELAGYALVPDNPQPGDLLTLTLYWRPQVRPNEHFTVFVQLLNSDNQVVAQSDSPPRSGHYPTIWWVPGETISDRHIISLPPGLPKGAYQLIAGLYQSKDGTRLPLQATTTFGPDAVVLTTLEIQSP